MKIPIFLFQNDEKSMIGKIKINMYQNVPNWSISFIISFFNFFFRSASATPYFPPVQKVSKLYLLVFWNYSKKKIFCDFVHVHNHFRVFWSCPYIYTLFLHKLFYKKLTRNPKMLRNFSYYSSPIIELRSCIRGFLTKQG